MENNYQIVYLIATCFIGYFIISSVFKRLNQTNLEGALKSSNGIMLINLKHFLGILLFGVIIYITVPEYRTLAHAPEIPKLDILMLFFLIAFMSGYLAYKSAKKKLKQTDIIFNYGLNNVFYYFTIRFIFLFAYEFFFRGVLFFTLLEISSLALAITFTTLLYILIHIFDTKEEIFGALPFGIVLCLFSYFTNTIWLAFLIHVTLSGVYEISVFIHLTLKQKKS